MRFKQITVDRDGDPVAVRLGKPLDARLAGRESLVVVRIEKTDVYEVVTIHRMSGSARRFSFEQDQVRSAELDPLA